MAARAAGLAVPPGAAALDRARPTLAEVVRRRRVPAAGAIPGPPGRLAEAVERLEDDALLNGRPRLRAADPVRTLARRWWLPSPRRRVAPFALHAALGRPRACATRACRAHRTGGVAALAARAPRSLDGGRPGPVVVQACRLVGAGAVRELDRRPLRAAPPARRSAPGSAAGARARRRRLRARPRGRRRPAQVLVDDVPVDSWTLDAATPDADAARARARRHRARRRARPRLRSRRPGRRPRSSASAPTAARLAAWVRHVIVRSL